MTDEFLIKLIFGLQGTMWVGLLGVYVWSWKLSQKTDEKLGKMYDSMNRHNQKSSIHQDANEFVRMELFQTMNDQMKEDISEIKTDVKELVKKAG